MVLFLLACTPEKPACAPVDGYADADGDGWGAAAVTGCPGEVVDVAGDCDDGDAAVNPDAAEVCDDGDVDEDCDGLADDADEDVSGAVARYTDADLDGYGAGKPIGTSCDDGVATADDCDDADPAVSPGAAEACDGLDTDCDPATGEDGLGTWSGETTETFTTLGDRELAEAGTLALCAGEWEGSLIIAADVAVTGPAGSAATTLTGAGTLITVTADATIVTVDGLTLTGGIGTMATDEGRLGAGALGCDGAATLTVEDVDFVANSAALGGAIATDGCTVYVWRGVMDGNTAEVGGAVWVRNGHVELSRLDMTGNTASDRGGALAVDAGRSGAFLVLGDALLTGNQAPAAGAVSLEGDVGLHCYGTGREQAGLIANTSADGGALTTDAESGAEFIQCDLGEAGTADDNVPIDVTTLAGDFALGDDVLAWCVATGCTEL